MTIRKETFYGTEVETYYVDARGRVWLVQHPEMTEAQVAVSADAPAGEELRVDDEDLQYLAAKLDRLPQGAGGVISVGDLTP